MYRYDTVLGKYYTTKIKKTRLKQTHTFSTKKRRKKTYGKTKPTLNSTTTTKTHGKNKLHKLSTV